MTAGLAGNKIPVGTGAVTAKKVTVQSKGTSISLTMEVTAEGISAATPISLNVAGELAWKQIERDIDGRLFGVFSFAIDFVGAMNKSDSVPESFAQKALSAAFNVENVPLKIPLPLDFSLPLSYNDKFTLETAHKGRVILAVKAEAAKIEKKVSALSPVIVKDGIWLCADYDQPAEASENKDAYEKQATTTMSQLLIRGAFLADMINELGKKPIKAHATVLEHSGSLAYQKWSDKTLGKGGIDCWLQNNDGTGDLTLTPSAKWDAQKGLVVTCTYEASAQADLHIHVDPLISGGIGTSIGCNVKAEKGTFSAAFKTMLTTNEAASALSLVPTLDPGAELTLKGESDGKCKLGNLLGITLAVPKVGAKVTIPVPRDVLGTIPLITTAPRRLLPEGMMEPMPCATLIPKNLPWRDEEGFALGFDVKFEKLAKEEITARTAAVEAAQLRTERPSLKPGSISILLGGLEFGKGNEFIKIALAVFNGVMQAAKTAGEAATEVGRWGQNAGREVARAYRNTEREVTVAGKNIEREVGRAGKNTERTVSKAASDTAREMGRFGTNVGREVKNAGKAVENNVQKAGNWIKKTFRF
ncbi:MAG: hypothetical protein K1X78_12575 [Verrucomicrobiaceae bacterium]|nr:hypothetical protein [Verrucomicrobiaceae bacterium]